MDRFKYEEHTTNLINKGAKNAKKANEIVQIKTSPPLNETLFHSIGKVVFDQAP